MPKSVFFVRFKAKNSEISFPLEIKYARKKNLPALKLAPVHPKGVRNEGFAITFFFGERKVLARVDNGQEGRGLQNLPTYYQSPFLTPGNK